MSIVLIPKDSKGDFVMSQKPFSSHEDAGMKLSTEIYGVRKECIVGDTVIDHVIACDNCRFYGLQVVWAGGIQYADFKVFDTPTGTVSGTANAELSHYGKTVNIAKETFEYKSPFEVALIKDMKLQLIVNSDIIQTLGVNFLLMKASPII